MLDAEDIYDGPRATLRWSPQAGFELDFQAEIDEVSLRLVGVAVPADGTRELGEGVELHKLEILFKAVVDFEGAPGQLHDARVQLLADELLLTATVEDAETGATAAFRAEAPVQVPAAAPEAGGPRPRPPEEDDLDWEDEETLEQLFGDVMPVSDRRDEPERSERRTGGLAALLRAIASADSDAEPAAASEPRHDKEEPMSPVRDAAPAPRSSALDDEARSFLDLLIEHEHLALADGSEVDDLVPGLAPLLAARQRSEAKASLVSEWLIGQDAVDELFIDDESLAALIEQW